MGWRGGVCGWVKGRGGGGSRLCCKDLGIDSGPFDMLICLLTALIACSSQRGLQSGCIFFYFFKGQTEEQGRGEEEGGGHRRRGSDFNVICKLVNPHCLTNSLKKKYTTE